MASRAHMFASECHGLVLAAGAAKRLSAYPKPFVWWQGSFLVERAVSLLLESGLASVTLVAREEHLEPLKDIPLFRQLQRQRKLTLVAPPIAADSGLAASLKTGFFSFWERASLEARGLVVHQVDRPFVRPLHIQRLLQGVEQMKQNDSKVPVGISQWRDTCQPPAFLPRHIGSAIQELNGDQGLKVLLRQGLESVVVDQQLTESDEHFATDCDVPNDLRWLRSFPEGDPVLRFAGFRGVGAVATSDPPK